MNGADSKSVVDVLVKALGDECVVVKNHLDNPDLLRQKRWVVEDLGGALHILYQGSTLGLIDLGELSFATDFGCNAENLKDIPQSIADQAREWAEQEMWPAWDARGYIVDPGAHPENGWDPLERLWLINVVKKLESAEALVEEIRWAANQERIQFIQ